MKLTKEQKAELQQKLSYPWGRVNLLCDGDRITLAVVQGKALKFFVVTYINGWFRGEWMLADKPAREQRYLRKVVRPFWSAAKRAQLEKELGKRWVKKHCSKTYTYFDAKWSSGKAAIAHLSKVCESVEIDRDGELEVSVDKTLDVVEN